METEPPQPIPSNPANTEAGLAFEQLTTECRPISSGTQRIVNYHRLADLVPQQPLFSCAVLAQNGLAQLAPRIIAARLKAGVIVKGVILNLRGSAYL